MQGNILDPVPITNAATFFRRRLYVSHILLVFNVLHHSPGNWEMRQNNLCWHSHCPYLSICAEVPTIPIYQVYKISTCTKLTPGILLNVLQTLRVQNTFIINILNSGWYVKTIISFIFLNVGFQTNFTFIWYVFLVINLTLQITLYYNSSICTLYTPPPCLIIFHFIFLF